MHRLYSLDTFDGLLYCVTRDENVVLRTNSLSEAAALYASLTGLPAHLIDRPTHSVEQDLLIAESCLAECAEVTAQ